MKRLRRASAFLLLSMVLLWQGAIIAGHGVHADIDPSSKADCKVCGLFHGGQPAIAGQPAMVFPPASHTAPVADPAPPATSHLPYLPDTRAPPA